MKGSNLWEKHNVIINGERIVKVARVAQQVAAPTTLFKKARRGRERESARMVEQAGGGRSE